MVFASLEEMLELTAEIAANVFKKAGQVDPVWVCETKTGDVKVIFASMPPRDQRDAFAEALSRTFAEMGVLRYCFTHEAWFVITRPEQGIPESHRLGASLASHPDRQEAVMLHAEDAERCIAGQYVILRPEHGPAKLTPFQKVEGNMEGRFVGLLKPHK